jgi:DNA-binding transcriptional ArsR family regulator
MFGRKNCRCRVKHQKVNFRVFEELEEDLRTVSVASKMAILQSLEVPHCVCDLVSLTSLSQTLISHHLSELEEKGFVEGKMEGRFRRFFLTEKGKRFLEIIKSLLSK